MSYLNTPRLVFAGKFLARPSTVNNDPEHFNTATFQPDYQQLQTSQFEPNGWWNPGGDAAWDFVGCVVTAVYYKDGTSCTDPSSDPIIGAPLNEAPPPIPAKIVDLDPEQQSVSELWGFQVSLGKSGSGLGFTSSFRVAPFGDLWFNRCPSVGGDTGASAFYQSVLESIQWTGAGNSRFLKELSEGGPPSQLSIRFNVDGYDQGPKTGRLVGSLGPYRPGEPSRFVAGRALLPEDKDQDPAYALPVGDYNPAYAQLDGDLLTLDLGNSLQTETPGGAFIEKGPLTVALLPPGGDPIPIGTVTTADPWFSQTAGIATFRLDPTALAQAESTPIGVLVPQSGGSSKRVLGESPSGTWVRADEFVFRLSPGYRTKTKFYARLFGKPLKSVIVLGYNATNMAGQTAQGPIPGPATVGEPTSALVFPPAIETGDDGTAVLTIQAGNPGNPRTYIDGQLYGITYAIYSQAAAPPDLTANVTNASLTLNVLLWSKYDIPPVPTWVNDVGPIFQQFADLYPVMKPIVDLSSYDDVVAKRARIKHVFNLPVTDPGYMPVTRDLSDAKRLMILKWLDNPLYTHPDGLPSGA